MTDPQRVRILVKRTGGRGEWHGLVECARTGLTMYQSHPFHGRGAKNRAREYARGWVTQQGYTIEEG